MRRRTFKPAGLFWPLYVVAVLALGLGLIAPASAASVPREALQYRSELIRNARVVWGLDAPVATFAAQVHQESRWRADAKSPVGAGGIAQFMPSTATWIGQAYADLADADPFNPSWGLRALVTYDQHIWDRTSAATGCDRMAKTLAGYNGGPGWVTRDERLAKANGADPSRWFGQVEHHNAGRSPAAFRENRGYPRRILLELEPAYVEAGWGAGSCA